MISERLPTILIASSSPTRFTYGKLVAIATIVITGFVQLGQGNVQHFTFENTETDFAKIALSFYSALFAYNGWNYLNFVIEELKDPHRNLPKAIFISCILVTVCYTFTIIAYHSALSPGEVLSSEAVAVVSRPKKFDNFGCFLSKFVRGCFRFLTNWWTNPH